MLGKIGMKKIKNGGITVAAILTLLILSSFICGSCSDNEDGSQTEGEKVQDETSFVNSRQFKGNTRKIIFLGIDAFDWNIILPLIKQGKMPNLGRITKEGAWAKLQSFGSTISPIVWTTIATGKMPEKHGIVNFIVKDRDSNETRPIDSTYRNTKAIWNIFSDFDLGVGLIDWQVSFPPEEVNGFVVANLMFNEEHKSNPPAIQTYYEKEISLRKPGGIRDESDWDRIIRKQRYMMDYVEQVALLMEPKPRVNLFTRIRMILFFKVWDLKYDMDFFAVYTHALDEIQHHFWKFRAPELFQDPIWRLDNDDVEKYQNVIDEFNVRADQMIGKFMSPEYTIVVVSDHGSRPQTKKRTYFQMNRLLKSMGLLAFDDRKEDVDFSRTQVYEGGFDRWNRYIGISANLKGREPKGIVPEASYNEMIEKLIGDLSSIKLVESGQPIFKQVTRVEDFDKKEQLVASMDIILEQDTSLLFANPEYHLNLNGETCPLIDYLVIDAISGTHALYGIFAAMGDGIKPGRIKDGKMVDVTPTLLYMMGMPVGKDMDGVVLKEMFTDEYLRENPIKYLSSYDNVRTKFAETRERRKKSTADDEIKEKLRALGYIN